MELLGYTKYLWNKKAVEDDANATNIPQQISTIVTMKGQFFIVA